MISIGELCQFRVSSLKALLDLVSLARLHPYISLSVCAFVVLALSSSPSIFWPEPGHASARTSESLQALLSVVTPTRSSWPPNYIALVERAGTSRSKTIQLPLSDVYRDISAGRIELRDPKNDLSDLFRKQVQAYGWLIQFYIDIPLWMNVLRWVAASHLPSFKPVLSPLELSLLSDTRCNAAASPEMVELNNSDEETFDSGYTFPLVSTAVVPVLCLDFIPYGHLEPFICSLKAASPFGDSATTLEFTTIGPSISFFSTPFILCSIPFLPRKYRSRQNQLTVRTSNPLLTSLHHVITLLMSDSTVLTVKAVSNISEEYATQLNMIGRELETDRRMRALLISQWGIEGWREHRFLMAWEAALFKVGYLMKWNVVVER